MDARLQAMSCILNFTLSQGTYCSGALQSATYAILMWVLIPNNIKMLNCLQ